MRSLSTTRRSRLLLLAVVVAAAVACNTAEGSDPASDARLLDDAPDDLAASRCADLFELDALREHAVDVDRLRDGYAALVETSSDAARFATVAQRAVDALLVDPDAGDPIVRVAMFEFSAAITQLALACAYEGHFAVPLE